MYTRLFCVIFIYILLTFPDFSNKLEVGHALKSHASGCETPENCHSFLTTDGNTAKIELGLYSV